MREARALVEVEVGEDSGANRGRGKPGEMAIALADLLEVISARPVPGALWDPSRTWGGGASIDSRLVRPGEIFFALGGQRTDGHLFVAEALQRGAVAAVVCGETWSALGASAAPAGAAGLAGPVLAVSDAVRALQDLARWHRSCLGVRIVAITGSAGKTTTKEMTAQAVTRSFRTVATQGNLNNHLGLPLTLLAIRPEHEVAVVELGASRPGDITFLCEIARPDIGVLTGIGEAHLESFGSVEEVVDTKWELARSLGRDRTLVMNGDDERLRGRAARWPGRLVTFGFGSEAHVRGTEALAVDASQPLPGASMCVEGQPVRLKLLGRGALQASLAALAVARELRVPLPEAIGALEEIAPLPGRLYPHSYGEIVLLDDTYNANPMAVANALEVLATWPGVQRRILALGDMLELGAASERLHRDVGRRAAQARVDLLFLWGTWAEEIAKGARDEGLSAEAIHLASSREDLARALARAMVPGDLILLKASRGRRLDEVTAALLAQEASRRGSPDGREK